MSVATAESLVRQPAPKPSFELVRKLWRVGIIFFTGDRRVKARVLLVLVLVLCAVCSGTVSLSLSLSVSPGPLCFDLTFPGFLKVHR